MASRHRDGFGAAPKIRGMAGRVLVIAFATIGDQFTRLADEGRQIEPVSASVLRSVQVLPDGERSVVERPRRSTHGDTGPTAQRVGL